MKQTMFFLILTMFSLSSSFAQFKNVKLEGKFGSCILQKIKSINTERLKMQKKDSDIAKQFSDKIVPIDNNLRLFVGIRINSDKVIGELINLGCAIIDSGRKVNNIRDIYLWAPYDSLENIANLNDVISINEKAIAITNTP